MRKVSGSILFRIIAISLAIIVLHKLASTPLSSLNRMPFRLPHLRASARQVSQRVAMSSSDFRTFNRLADQMEYYHSLLRGTWDKLRAGTAPDARSPSASVLVSLGLQFCEHLKGHHDIEESYWFPILGQKMDDFKGHGFAKEQHRTIHKGLGVLLEYLSDCKSGRQELRRSDIRNIMDSFESILWTHLNDEVEALGADNMKKYWTKEEMNSFPF